MTNSLLSIREQRLACVSDQTRSFIDVFGRKQGFPHFLWASCCTNYRVLLDPHLLNALKTQAATQTIPSLPSLEASVLSARVQTENERSLSLSLYSAVHHFSYRGARSLRASAEPWCCGGLHVDLGTLTSTCWACGLTTASRLLFCPSNRITSTVQKKKKERRNVAVSGSRAKQLYSAFRRVLGVRLAGGWGAEHVHRQTLGRSETLSRGISCWSPRNEAAGSRSVGFALKTSVSGNAIPRVWCDNFPDK